MTDTRAQSPPSSIASSPSRRARRWSRAHFLGDARRVRARRGGAAVRRAGRRGAARRACMAGGILAVACDGARILTGGDDGKVVATEAKGESETLATDAKHRWIDRVALGPDGAVAWSAGKQAFVRTAKGEAKSLDLPSSVGGLAFAPKGLRLAVAHYGGVTLWFPERAGDARDVRLEGLASRRAVQPGRQVPRHRMQEPTLHGWRLADAKDMRMSGYSAKVRSMAWTAGGKWLATSGSEQLILWPFASQGRPDGQAAAHARALRQARGRGRLPSEAGDRRGRLRGRPGDAVPHRGRRGDSGEEAGRRAGLGARLECRTARSSRSARKTARPGFTDLA